MSASFRRICADIGLEAEEIRTRRGWPSAGHADPRIPPLWQDKSRYIEDRRNARIEHGQASDNDADRDRFLGPIEVPATGSGALRHSDRC
jgi:hypothetical protein